MRLQSLHCPNCGAAIHAPGQGARVVCGYCKLSLAIERERVTSPGPRARPVDAAEPEDAPFDPPEATLFTVESERFELSVLEQRVEGGAPQRWEGIDLPGKRFALVELRTVDASGNPVPGDLDALLEVVRTSLADDGDPGLAANLALDSLASGARLELGILLFDSGPMTVTAYQAGCRDAAWWLSQEEGRSIAISSRRPVLERKFLREARDHFSNDPPIALATGDLLLWLSAGVLGRGASPPQSSNLRPLLDVLGDNLGEDPLRVVTLTKNAFWADRLQKRPERSLAPVGDVVLAGVRAIPPVLATTLPGSGSIQSHTTPRFDLALRRTPGDAAVLHPLHGERSVLIWLAPRIGKLADGALEVASNAVLAVLDRPNHGDNDNARLAGREVLAALGADVNLAVIQMLEPHGKVAFFTHGWRPPLQLADRANHSSGQWFDGGGEAFPKDGGRLLFPGALPIARPATDAAGLAKVWSGGKASRLYQAAIDHWKARDTARALERLGLAAASDVQLPHLDGLALLTLRA